MACISFSGGSYAQLRICSNPTLFQNTYTDQTADANNSVAFIMQRGKAYGTTVGSSHLLGFGTVDCPDNPTATTPTPQPTIHPYATLIIRFTRKQERVTFRMNFDGPGDPAIVNFYKDAGNPVLSNQADSRSIPWPGTNQLFSVVYDNCCHPVQEIVIRTNRAENTLDDLCWERSHNYKKYPFLPWPVCVCPSTKPRFRDLIVGRR